METLRIPRVLARLGTDGSGGGRDGWQSSIPPVSYGTNQVGSFPGIRLLLALSNRRARQDLVWLPERRGGDISVLHRGGKLHTFMGIACVYDRLCLLLPPSGSRWRYSNTFLLDGYGPNQLIHTADQLKKETKRLLRGREEGKRAKRITKRKISLRVI